MSTKRENEWGCLYTTCIPFHALLLGAFKIFFLWPIKKEKKRKRERESLEMSTRRKNEWGCLYTTCIPFCTLLLGTFNMFFHWPIRERERERETDKAVCREIFKNPGPAKISWTLQKCSCIMSQMLYTTLLLKHCINLIGCVTQTTFEGANVRDPYAFLIGSLFLRNESKRKDKNQNSAVKFFFLF